MPLSAPWAREITPLAPLARVVIMRAADKLSGFDMDITFTPEEEKFRADVRSFLEESLPKLGKSSRRDFETKDDFLAWHRLLYKKGWVAPHWPAQYGGTGWNVTQRYIYNEESARAGAPQLLPFGLTMVAPAMTNRRRNICRAFCRARIGGVRGIPNRAPVPIWPA
jgi:hypothetical protein